MWDFYRLPTKFQEGSFQSCVMCLSVHRESPMWSLPIMHLISLYRALVPLPSDIWWPRLETCSNLFTWVPPLYQPSSVGELAVRFLQECFLVILDAFMCLWSILWKLCKVNFLSVLGTWSVLHFIDVSTGGDLNCDKCCNTSPTVHVAETDKSCKPWIQSIIPIRLKLAKADVKHNSFSCVK